VIVLSIKTIGNIDYFARSCHGWDMTACGKVLIARLDVNLQREPGSPCAD
jgi:hypothetical protein